MQASAPSRIALATSVASARVGRGDSCMLSSICVAMITGRWKLMARGDDPLLLDRHLGHVDLHAQVAAGDHHDVGVRDDLVEPLERLAFFDLRDDARRRAARTQNVFRACGRRRASGRSSG